MRALGLDIGVKTIGVAASDELGLAAHPVETIARRGTEADVARVVALVAEREVGDVVVGLPLELSGQAGRRARRVRLFIDALGRALGDEVGVHEWDERFSTAAVERVLVDADLSRRRRKQVIDKQAAAYILQGWLDARRQPE
ncbi:Holliday junction resolvase RuvX [Haliangium sp.]|uniref:Holliday junction resolvase RuvX n=1 Tax=Haliangium sp. TaxID=2663208 RepID=UPI003D0B1A09